MRILNLFLAALSVAACSNTTTSSGGETDVTADVQPDGSDASDLCLEDLCDTFTPDATPDAATDTTAADVSPTDAADAADAVDAVDAGDVGPVGEYGFSYRKQQSVDLTCSKGGPMGNGGTFAYTDWLCTFAHGATQGYLYVQGTPSDCTCTMGCTPVFTTQGWLSVGGKVTALSPVSYDWGGNHNNDSVEFAFAGETYKAYHSSFGFGWRKCQPMDCLQVEDKIAGTVSEDGCTKARTLPIACVPILPDGTHAALTDKFKPCLGDPNYP